MDNYDVVIGIDIGLSGGISFFDTVSKELMSVYEMPTTINDNGKKIVDIDKLLFILEIPKVHNEKAIIVYEAIHAFGNSGFGVGVLMEEKGVVRGLAKALGYDELAVSPKTWQKVFGLVPPKDLKGSTAKKTKYLRRKWIKENSIRVARMEFVEWAVSKLKSKTCDGVSDSMLIGKWYLDNN